MQMIPANFKELSFIKPKGYNHCLQGITHAVTNLHAYLHNQIKGKVVPVLN
jgi:hypothetical protein